MGQVLDRTPNTRSRNAAATRDGILSTARELFARDSYDDVGMRDIARKAGVDPALIHRYFGTKEDLFAATLDSCKVQHDLFSGPRDTFGRRLAEQIVHEPKSGMKLLGVQIMLRSIGSAKATDIVQSSARVDFFEPFESWLGGPDASLRVRILAGLMMGMKISRELDGGFGLPEEDSSQLCDRLAVLIQSVVDDR